MSEQSAPSSSSKSTLIPAIAEDGSLYAIDKMEAHELGALHVAISVFLFDKSGNLLIQRRAAEKYHCGGLWANTVCTHPKWRPGAPEHPASAAARRMREELGALSTPPLRRGALFEYRADVGGGLIEHERVHVFHGEVDAETYVVALNPDEVAETRWAAPSDLRAELDATSERFTPWFQIYLREWDRLGLPLHIDD